MEGPATPALPEDPALAAMAAALRDASHWAEIVDRDWRLVYSTDDLRRIYGGLTDLAPVALRARASRPAQPAGARLPLRRSWNVSGPTTLPA